MLLQESLSRPYQDEKLSGQIAIARSAGPLFAMSAIQKLSRSNTQRF